MFFCRSQAAVLLSALSPGMLDERAMCAGFVALLDAVEDLTLDVPEAPSELAMCACPRTSSPTLISQAA